MRRVLFGFGLLLMAASLGFFIVAWTQDRVTDALLHAMAAAFFVGAILSALMADPKSLLGFLDRAVSLRTGRSTSSEKSSGGPAS